MHSPLSSPDLQPARDGSGEMFDRIAERYDLLNRVMSLGMDRNWRRHAVLALRLEGGYRILDLATGTADLAAAVATAASNVHVIGVDPSRKMLEVGRRKIASWGLSERVELVEGDAQKLPYADKSFDGLCMAFGIRNVPDRAAALREMARVVRKSGRIALLELSEPGEGWMSVPARWYVHHVIPRIGSILSGEREYTYLQRSIAAFPAASTFAATMVEAGLEVLEIKRLGMGACHLYVATPKEAHP